MNFNHGLIVICPMKKHILIIFSSLIFLAFTFANPCSAAGQSQYNDKAELNTHYQQAKFFYNQLKTNAKLSASRDNWLKGAGNFRRIYLAEPKSDYAPACLFMLGRLYFDMYKTFGKGIDLGESISYYRDVGSLFPGHRFADDAYYAVGIILLEEVHDPRRAAKSFGKIVSEYQGGDMHAQAETKLKILTKDFDIPLPTVMVGNSQLMKLTNVLPVKYWSSNDYTRVVIKTSGPVTYREELLEEIGKQPRRLYIDFLESYIEPRFRSPVPIEDGLLQRVRTGQYTTDTVRVVLDIESISSYKIFSLPDPFRVVIDVRGENKKPQRSQAIDRKESPDHLSLSPNSRGTATGSDTPMPGQNQLEPSPPDNSAIGNEDNNVVTVIVLNDKKKTHVAEKNNGNNLEYNDRQDPPVNSRISLAQQLGLGVGKIVIDPGHGGKDPGALAFGLKEKDIVLKVAKNLAHHLKKDMNAEVILTRDSDTFLPLEERTAIANTNDADLFISLHINAHPSPEVKGFETYFLNLSTNDEAMRVAARENATSAHQMSDLEDILSDIMQNSKINESSRLAQQVHNSIANGLDTPYTIKDMGVKQAPFYVLIGAGMPAILIELAFISNPEDARLLGDDTFIDKMTAEISQGILEYVNANTAQL
jgi:N-acetylmuramoyl-L-alanine amidase